MGEENEASILIVDDHVHNLDALEAILSDMELRIVRAASGRDALRHVLRNEFAVILLDVQMPGMDGFETAAAIHGRERSGHVPIIFVTAIERSEACVSRGYEFGAADYVFKPVPPNVLRAKVKVFVDLFKTAQALARSEARLQQMNETLEQQVAERTEALRAKTDETLEMSQQLWQAARLATMGELAAGITHEINNPLATVSLRLEWLLGQMTENDPKRRALEVIEQEIERISHLAAGFLQFGRRSSRQISTLNVCDEIDGTLDLVNYNLRNRHITTVRDFQPGLPMIQADRQQLRQIFLNLFTNASDAMPDGGTLTVRLVVRDVAGGADSASPAAVVIEVTDTGTGIPPNLLSRVTESFFTTKPEGKGTGLGLPMCRRLVHEHGGTMSLESEVGTGTTVRIMLPVARGIGNGAGEGLTDQLLQGAPGTVAEETGGTAEPAAGQGEVQREQLPVGG